MEKLNVKPGDEVLCIGRYREHILKVSKVTPTGNIRTADGGYYNQYGFEKGGEAFNRTHIVELTSERKQELLEGELVRDTYRLMKGTDSLTYDQAVKIREILGGTA